MVKDGYCVGRCILANYLHDWNAGRTTTAEVVPNLCMYRDGMVTRWRPNRLDPQPVQQDRRVVQAAALIACPTCRTTLDRHCQTGTGRHRVDHGTRLVERRCPCGERLQYGKKMCEPCRLEARRHRGTKVAA